MRTSTCSESRSTASTFARGIRVPLAALRASIEALELELVGNDVARQVIQRALDELVRVDHSAEALIELSSPSPLQPLRCSLRELAQSALAALPGSRRTRVWVALEPELDSLVVDGPVLVRALATLLERATDGGAEVLLHAHQDDDVTTFAIVSDLGGRELELFDNEPSTPAWHELGVEVAQRDVARMGGEVLRHAASAEHGCILVRIPEANAAAWEGESG